MAVTQTRISELDPVWRRITEEAEAAVGDEPLLGGVLHSCILHHKNLESALAYRLAQKLASSEMSEQILREIADEAYGAGPGWAAARADIVAVYDRDPACHRFLQPILYFKGFQAVQAYRVGHWLWTEGRKTWPTSSRCGSPRFSGSTSTRRPGLALALVRVEVRLRSRIALGVTSTSSSSSI
jgi:serine O-acetyltransferase